MVQFSGGRSNAPFGWNMKDQIIGTLAVVVFYWVSQLLSSFAPVDVKSIIGFLFGAASVTFLVYYYTRS